MKPGLKLWSFLLLLLAACHRHEDRIVPDPTPRTAAEPGPTVDPLVMKSGLGSGTFTVTSGYIVGWCAVAETDGGIATVTVTPSGPTIKDAGPQQPVYIPSGLWFCLPRPVIAGTSYEMGTGTTIVFSGTETWQVTLSQGGT